MICIKSGTIFFLAPPGNQRQPWSMDVMNIDMVWARQPSQDGSFQTSLRYQQISYAGLTPSSLKPETFPFPRTVLSVTLRSIHASPWISFAHTALCGGEVQRHTFWEPLLGFSLFFSMTIYLSHSLTFIFIHIYIRYHPIPSRSSICYTKKDQF